MSDVGVHKTNTGWSSPEEVSCTRWRNAGHVYAMLFSSY